MKINKLTWEIGGAQGSGVDSSATIFSRACARSGLHIFGKREYYSNIKGEHSYFQVRVDENIVRASLNSVNLLATFDFETLVRHAGEVSPDGGIVYDAAVVGQKIESIPTLEKRVLNDMLEEMRSEGFEPTGRGILERAEKKGIRLFPVSYDQLLKQLASRIGETQISRIARAVNVIAVAASLTILGLDYAYLERAISDVFGSKPKVVDLNLKAAALTRDYVEHSLEDGFSYKLEARPTSEQRILVQGSQAIALGKLAAGCRFQTYYPITPASDESEYLEAHAVFKTDGNPDHGSILVFQSEDEISAITMAVGAGLTGVRASTSTSGPGFSLMAEGLGWAGINEVPVVVTLYQRGGPSTGLPTRHEQGDLWFALHTGHGEFPRIILASGDLEECFHDVTLSFNYAEKYQLPVIHIVDKALANTNATYTLFDQKKIEIDRGATLFEWNDSTPEKPERYMRFKLTDTGISPRIVLGTSGAVFWNTGDEHDELGHITEDPVLHEKMMEKRIGKLDTAAAEIPLSQKVNFFGKTNPDILVVSWGSTKGAISEAVERLEAEGTSVGFLQIRLIHPFPSEYVFDVLSRAKVKVGIEMNYSAQLSSIVRERTGVAMDNIIVKYNGRPFSTDEVYDGIRKIVQGGAPLRIVMHHGA